MTQRDHLRQIAIAAMRSRGLEPEFPRAALAEADAVRQPPRAADEPTRDLRSLLWCSIDNDDSRDLDQLSVAESFDDGSVKVLVAIADVDVVVRPSSAVDRHAAINTTSVYTPAVIFPMLPERLSTDLTSLADHQDRLSIVIEYVVSRDGELASSTVYGAMVRNQAKLAYRTVGAWLEGAGPLPPAAAAVPGMDRQLKIQDGVAQALAQVRHEHGALQFESDDVEHVFDGDQLSEVRAAAPNRAKALIENLMVAANGVTARFLEARGFPSLRRVVRSPERWDRIRDLAAQSSAQLPAEPDSVALSEFLVKRKDADPDRFADLSRTVIKLLGRGEYVVERPGGSEPQGHFALAVKAYTHSTAPNRRYPDLLTQRLLKAALTGQRAPYATEELDRLAEHCTTQEDAANKVERQVRKSAAAMLVESRIGATFDAIVTGVTASGTFVRVTTPPIEGMLARGAGVDVGDRVRVRLASVDVDRGYIDFEKV
ncbi:MAG TPA: RNB domain-containing ribonuclease [Vicinamibacterales bacterium]|nr:RNB domain-containing ribonuclease [Vicinamibacterales bacterium]